MPELKIIADENIPLVARLFGRFGTVTTRPGREISREDLLDADVLLVRSVTRVNEDLLKGTAVRFVGSATIGVDHIETDFLHRCGIAFAHAPGSNADSVVEYVIAALLHLSVRRAVPLRGRVVGIVGCGAIGSRLAARLQALGLSILKNDPPLAREAEQEGRSHEFASLEDVVRACDIITLHVPLVRNGAFATEHLFDHARISAMKPGAWLINTSRGPIVDNRALFHLLDRGTAAPGGTILDVWEGEPDPDCALLGVVDIATPHIAGYSYDGKIAGTLMLHRALCEFLGGSCRDDAPDLPRPAVPPLVAPDPTLPETDWLHALVRQMYPIGEDDLRMRALCLEKDPRARARLFTELRRDYPMRRTFSAHAIQPELVPDRLRKAVTEGLHVHSR